MPATDHPCPNCNQIGGPSPTRESSEHDTPSSVSALGARKRRRVSWRDRLIFLATVAVLSCLFVSVPMLLGCNSNFLHDILHSTCRMKLGYENFRNLEAMGIFLELLVPLTPIYWAFDALVSAIVGD